MLNCLVVLLKFSVYFMSWFDSWKEVHYVFIQLRKPWTISEDIAHPPKMAPELICGLELFQFVGA